jgi:YHS domain-containing protein
MMCGVVMGASEPATQPLAATQPSTQPSADADADTPPVNNFCAVETDEEIDPTITIMYNGMKIGFCCKDCIKDFKKNPDKYLPNMK